MNKIELSKKSQKFLKRCDNKIRDRITYKIRNLSNNPFPSDCKRVEKTDYFRVRIGDFRVLYRLYKDKNILLIANIDKRSKVYRQSN